MASRGCGRRCCPRGSRRPPPGFDQQAFVTAMGAAAAAIAQASAIGNQGGSSNLQRFEAHDPLALKGGGDPMVAGYCFRLVGKDTGTIVTMATTIARTSATVGQEGTSNLQGFQVHHPPTYMGGGDSMVRTTLAIGRGVDNTWSIRDMGASNKRKENQSSSNSRRKQKISIPLGFQGRGGGY